MSEKVNRSNERKYSVTYTRYECHLSPPAVDQGPNGAPQPWSHQHSSVPCCHSSGLAVSRDSAEKRQLCRHHLWAGQLAIACMPFAWASSATWLSRCLLLVSLPSSCTGTPTCVHTYDPLVLAVAGRISFLLQFCV